MWSIATLSYNSDTQLRLWYFLGLFKLSTFICKYSLLGSISEQVWFLWEKEPAVTSGPHIADIIVHVHIGCKRRSPLWLKNVCQFQTSLLMCGFSISICGLPLRYQYGRWNTKSFHLFWGKYTQSKLSFCSSLQFSSWAGISTTTARICTWFCIP